MKRRYFWIIPALLLGLICLKPVFAMDCNLETSIVSLIVKSNQEVIGNDDYFELIDFEEYQLVSLNSLAPRLELELDFHREQNLVTVYSRRFNREVQIYINDRKYLVDGMDVWGNQPPVALNGSFFVSSLLVEYVAQVKVIWSSRFQELTVQGDWLSPKTTNNPQIKPIIEADNVQSKGEKALEGPVFSLGRVQYELSWEKRRDSSGNEAAIRTLGVRSDGRAGPWTISLGGGWAWDDGKQSIDPALTLIRAKYNENNQLIILGDSEVSLDETLGTKELRGVLWMSSSLQPHKKLLSYTSISGMADIGDKIRLLVNDQLTGELTVTEGNSYVFTNVPLKLRRINTITIILTKTNGETVETCKRIAASPRMLQQGRCDYLVASGKYRQALLDPWSSDFAAGSQGGNVAFIPWEGSVTAFKIDYGINERITLNSEIARIRPVDCNGWETGVIDGADLGVAFRFGDGLFYTLDWLIGGEGNQNPLENGWNSSLLYEMENGCFEAVAFYVPDEVSKGLRNVMTGKGVRILGEVECAGDVTVKVNGNLAESIAAPGILQKEIKVMLNHHSGDETPVDHSVTITQSTNDTLSQTQHLTGLTYEHWTRGTGYSAEKRLGFYNLDLMNGESQNRFQSLSFEENYLKSINNSLLLGFTLNPAANWRDNQYYDMTLSAETELKWNHKNLWVSVKGSAAGTNETGTGSGFQWTTFELGGNVKYHFGKSTNGYLNCSRVMDNLGGQPYTSGEAGLSYQLPKKRGKVWAYAGYVSPLGEAYEPQWSYSLGVSKELRPGFEIVLETEKNYESRWSSSYEQVYRLSLRQALGFGNGQVRAVPYSTVENPAVVGGTVYLDENGNRWRDKCEKGLGNVRMMLDGSIAETDSEGNYLFTMVEPGIFRVNFDLRSLPADYTPVTGEQLVKLKPSENMFLDFGVTMNGSISGRAFIDSNANGRWDSGEHPLPWAGILQDGSQKYFTLQDGSFYIENLPLGMHTIAMIPETVPKGMEVKGKGEYQVHITGKCLDVTDVLFPVVFEFRE